MRRNHTYNGRAREGSFHERDVLLCMAVGKLLLPDFELNSHSPESIPSIHTEGRKEVLLPVRGNHISTHAAYAFIVRVGHVYY